MRNEDDRPGAPGGQQRGGVAEAERTARIRQEAAEWFARVGNGDAANRDAFKLWFAADPAHAAAYERLLAGWEKTAREADTVGLGRSPPSSWPKTLAFWAIAIAALALVGWFVAERLDGSRRGAITSPRDALRQVKLRGGYLLTLDANSTVVPKFTSTERQLGLTHGRARFEVAGDAGRPITVRTVLGTISAVSAVFDVSMAATTATVTVWRGAVDVRYRRAEKATPVRLTAPSRLTFNGHGAIYAPERPAASEQDWVKSARSGAAMTPSDVAPITHPDAGGGRSVHQ